MNYSVFVLRPILISSTAGMVAGSAPLQHLATLLSLAQAHHRFITLRIIPALVITTVFAIVAWNLRAVSRSGAIAGWCVSTTIFICAGPGGFLALATVFFLTTAATRLERERKRALRTAESLKGRNAGQVLANLAIAALATIPAVVRADSWFLVCAVAALAEAAADTVSSECGQAWSDRVYLVTNFERVRVGTDGGISIPGTLAGIAAAALVAWVSHAAHLVPRHTAILAGIAAVLGMFTDSLLGALVERRRWLGNNAVNFLSTLAAAVLAAIFLLQ